MFTTAIHGETLIKTILHNGIPMELLRVPPTIWCGSITYATNLTDEPDIPALLAKYQANCQYPKRHRANPEWDNCISIDYWQEGRVPRGMVFSQQVTSEEQDSAHDIYRMPESLYIRLACTKEAAQAAFGREECGVWELFGVIKDALDALGYRIGTNGAQEIEMYNHGAGLAYAYVPVEAIEHKGENNMNELREILEKFASCGWELIDKPSRDWLEGKDNCEELIAAIQEADKVCGSCGCEFDPLYKRALELLV